MELKTVLTCPLGHKCQEVKDNAIHQCAWFVKLAGTNPNTGDKVDEHGCAMNWMPILMIENSQQQLSTSSAIESFRNEMVSSNEQTASMLYHAAQVALTNKT